MARLGWECPRDGDRGWRMVLVTEASGPALDERHKMESVAGLQCCAHHGMRLVQHADV